MRHGLQSVLVLSVRGLVPVAQVVARGHLCFLMVYANFSPTLVGLCSGSIPVSFTCQLCCTLGLKIQLDLSLQTPNKRLNAAGIAINGQLGTDGRE